MRRAVCHCYMALDLTARGPQIHSLRAGAGWNQ